LALLLSLMVAIDLVFMATSFFWKWGWDVSSSWSVTHDRGYPELFMYVQEIMLVVLCLVLWKRTRQFFGLVWACIFIFLFLDDAFRLHENLGGVFAEWSQIERRGTMRGQDYGELLVWSPFIVLFALMTLLAHFKSEPRYRVFLWGLYVLAGLLLGLGVGVDILSRVYNFWGHTNIISIAEDGGEMVVVSMMVVWLLYWVGRVPADQAAAPVAPPATPGD